jgi:two-component system, OmpR family, response regulator
MTLARREAPLLAVLEVRLPDVSGLELATRLREELSPPLSIILTSSDRTEPMDRVAGLLLGADDYLVKPVDPDELLARARAVLRRAGSRPGSALIS